MRGFFLGLLLSAPLLVASVDSIRELIRAGRLAEAIAQCDIELKASPRSGPLWTLKGLALRASGENARAIDALRQAGAYPPALQALAQMEFDARDPNARATLRSVLKLDPASAPARSMLGTLDFESRDCAAVVASLAPVKDPPPGARWQLGICQFELGQYPTAAAQFESLLRLREHAPTRFNLALAQFHAKDHHAVIRTLASATDADALRLSASAHEAAGQLPQALDVLQRGIQNHPADERFVVDLAVLCLNHGNIPLGVQVVEAGRARHTDSAQLTTLLGILHVRGGDLEKGEAALRRAEERSPLGRIGLASLLMQLGLPDEAAIRLREAAHATPADDRAVVTYARAILQKNPLPQEAAELEPLLASAVQRDPRHAAVHALLGRVLLLRGQPARAATAFQKAIEFDPADRASAYRLMTLLQRQGRAREAAALAAKLKALTAAEREAEGRRFQLIRTDTP